MLSNFISGRVRIGLLTSLLLVTTLQAAGATESGPLPFAPRLDLPVAEYPVAVASADFDGNGRPDLVTGQTVEAAP